MSFYAYLVVSLRLHGNSQKKLHISACINMIVNMSFFFIFFYLKYSDNTRIKSN